METPSHIGKYLVVGAIGRGSMGQVFKAQDPSIGRFVAIKAVQTSMLGAGADEAAQQQLSILIERLRSEARAAGNLRHPNIVTIFEVGEDESYPYLVMDYVDGESLSGVIAKRAPLAPAEVLKILWQAASALDYAHERGVLHRDIKPANMIIDRAGQLQLLDFGIASLTMASISGELARDSARIAVPETVAVGTPAYMSPEQLLNKTVTHRSDLFSLAIVGFELMTGQRPFAGDSFHAVVGNILNGKRLSLLDLAPSLPLALEAEFEVALALEPEQRFGSAQAMVDAFAKAIGVDIVVRSASVMTPQIEPREFELSTKRRDSGIEHAPVLSGGGAAPRTSPRNSSALSRPPVGTTGSFGTTRSHADMFGGAVVQGGIGKARHGLSFGAIIALIICVTMVALGIAMLVAQPPVWVASLFGATPPTTNSMAMDESFAAIDPELEAPITEPAPPDRATAELSDRQVLGLIMNERGPEGIVKEGIDEAERRKLGGLSAALVIPLRHDAYLIRIRALEVLARLKDRRVVPAVMDVLDDHDPLVRGYAARCLGALGDRRALPYLTSRSASEPVPEVRESLRRAIERINGFVPGGS